MVLNIIVFFGVALIATFAGYSLRKHLAEKKIQNAEMQAQHILEQAKKEAQDRRREGELEAKDLLYRMRQDFERETKDRRQEIFNLEKRLTQKEENTREMLEKLIFDKELSYDIKMLSSKFNMDQFFEKDFYPLSLFYLGMLTFKDKFKMHLPNLTMKQIFIDGLFHADPHPGNILVTDDGRVRIFFEGRKVADIPVAPIVHKAPVYERPVEEPKYLREVQRFPLLEEKRVRGEERRRDEPVKRGGRGHDEQIEFAPLNLEQRGQALGERVGDEEPARCHKLAFRFKGSGGYPKDKYLFYLGSDTDLRGYDYKDIKGSSALLGSIEYRFPLTGDLDKRFFCNVFNLSKVQGVLFFDAGSAWYNHFNEAGFKKDAEFGLRIYFDVAGAAERLALRIDTAYPLDADKKEGPRVWVGINQAF